MINKVKVLFFRNGEKLKEEEYSPENGHFNAKEFRTIGNFEFNYSAVSKNDSDDFSTMYLVYEEI